MHKTVCSFRARPGPAPPAPQVLTHPPPSLVEHHVPWPDAGGGRGKAVGGGDLRGRNKKIFRESNE